MLNPTSIRSAILAVMAALFSVNVQAATSSKAELNQIIQDQKQLILALQKKQSELEAEVAEARVELARTKRGSVATPKASTTARDEPINSEAKSAPVRTDRQLTAVHSDESSWGFSIEGIAMQRDGMDSVPLVVDTGSSATLLDANDLDLDSGRGLKLSLSRDIGFLGDLELEYYRVNQLISSDNISAANAELIMYGATFGTAPIDLEYDTDLTNTELNWRYSWWDGRIKTLIGYRKIEIGESMEVTDTASPPRLFESDLSNKMHGWQLGIEGILFQHGPWEIEGGLKYARYHNSAKFHSAFPQAGPAAVFNAEQNDTARSRELWLGVNYNMSENVAVRFGYQAMRISDIAVLPEQLDDLYVPINNRLDMGGNVLYQGANLGVHFRW